MELKDVIDLYKARENAREEHERLANARYSKETIVKSDIAAERLRIAEEAYFQGVSKAARRED